MLKRLDDECISMLDDEHLAGIVIALSGMMDKALAEDKHNTLIRSLASRARTVANSCLKRLRELNPDKLADTIQLIAKDGQAINWLIAELFRSELFNHGRVGDQRTSPDDWVISDELLDKAIVILKERVRQPATQELISNLPDIPSYLFGWMNITEDDQAKSWVMEYSKSDEGFLKILMDLRSWVMSDKVYYVLREDSVKKFLDWDNVSERLESMKDGELADQVALIQLAIAQSEDW